MPTVTGGSVGRPQLRAARRRVTVDGVMSVM
ncbi:hypothetical protein RKD45_004765 [Streptomyces griseus]|nr:hypothetical protein [Streptomyces pratensis]